MRERDVLHHLIEICSDAERAFRTAAGRVEDFDLQMLFVQLADERRRFAAALTPHLYRFGDAIDAGGTNIGAMHRGWMTLRSLVPGDPDEAIVQEVERGERAALHAYDRALAGILPLTVDGLIEAQRNAIQKTHDRIASASYRERRAA